VIVGDVRTPLLVLLGAVGFVLLVACANVANLLLARASARQSELAVRAALGAGRSRLLRQLLTEAVVLGVAGGALGMALAYGGTKALVAAQPADIPRLEEVGVNGTVLLFTVTVALLTSLMFGLLPALQATRHRLAQALRDGGRGGDASSGGHRIRSTLIVAEIALAVVLLTGAGLLIRSFVELTRVDAGFQPDRAVAFRVALQGDAYDDPQTARLRVAELEDRLRAMRGVSDVAVTTTLPLSGRGSLIDFLVVSAPPPPPNVNREIGITSITPGYFQAIGTPLTRGRLFTDRDHDEAPLVAVVNEAAVGGWFPDRDPIGQRVSMSRQRYEIVGVVGDVLQEHPGQAALPQLFVPYAQRTTRSVRIVVRGAGDLLALVPAMRAEVRSLDRNLAIADVTPLRELLTGSMARPRFYTALLALFAGVALALAVIGIFGVTSYAVAQRTREIGVRMALGAAAGNVVGMIVGRAFALAGAGTLLGLGAALALGRVIQSQLFGVTLFDPVTLGVVALLLVASALVASLWPARRAARLDPSRVLRET
ncbi:MAG: ADOP family duplicated permease, partial [Vicinamibacteraceae bacterium]